jgi:hypothetical protein
MPAVKRRAGTAKSTLARVASEGTLPRASMTRQAKYAVPAPTAVLAAFVLFIHTLLIGLSAGVHASPVELDAFGNPLCLGAANQSGDENPASDHTQHGCCTFGCHFAAAPPLPDRLPLLVDFRPVEHVAWQRQDTSPRRSVERSSIRLRGPPRLV